MRTWLKRIRLQRGYTQVQIAAAAGISRTYYTQIEVEHPKKTPTPGIAMRIADELGFDWTWFFQEDRIPEELRESEVKRWTKDAANDFVALCERRGVKPAEAIKALSDYAERQKNAVG